MVSKGPTAGSHVLSEISHVLGAREARVHIHTGRAVGVRAHGGVLARKFAGHEAGDKQPMIETARNRSTFCS